MASRARYSFLTLVVLTGLLAAVLSHAAAWSLDAAGVANAAFLGRQVKLSELIGYSLALAAGLSAYFAATTRELLGEVIDELQRVSWPSRQETSHATLVVFVCVVISAACLGVFDGVWLAITGVILGSPRTAG